MIFKMIRQAQFEYFKIFTVENKYARAPLYFLIQWEQPSLMNCFYITYVQNSIVEKLDNVR
jgi:hypothetical protein